MMRLRTLTRATYLAAYLAFCSLNLAHSQSYDDMVLGVKSNFYQVVEGLLKRGFDVDTTDKYGNTLVMLACFNHATQTLPILLAANPRLDLRNQYGETALMLAALRHEKEMVIALLDAGALPEENGWTALHYAAMGGDQDIVALLIAKKAGLNTRSPDGSTPVIMAAKAGKTATLKVLLAAGADPNGEDAGGWSAMNWAIDRWDTNNRDLLLAAGAKPVINQPKTLRY